MNKEELIKKYLNGETTLEEEKELLESPNKDQALEVWSEFVTKNRQPAPVTLEKNLWIKIIRKKRQRLLIRFAAAASILVVIAFWVVGSQPTNQMSLSEKEQLLKDAQALFKEEAKAKKEIIYSDELIVIYTASR